MNNYRKLLVLGLNELLLRSLISLDEVEAARGHVLCELAGKPSVILWYPINAGESCISVWWNYDHSRHPQANLTGNSQEQFTTMSPLAKRARYPDFVGAVASCWLERETGKYLQGRGSKGLVETYTRRDDKALLDTLADPVPLGYGAEGKFFA